MTLVLPEPAKKPTDSLVFRSNLGRESSPDQQESALFGRGYRRYRLDDPGFHPLTYGHMIEEYIRHPETKSLGPDGRPCKAETRGLLQRAHITAGRIRYIDKETSSMWAQSDDLSVVTDNDEAGFRVVEYGKSRRVVLPDSLKGEIQGSKLTAPVATARDWTAHH